MKQFIFYLVDGRCLFPVESTYLNLEVAVLIFCPGLNAHSTFVLCFCVVLNCKQEVADGDPGSHCTDTSTITTRPRYQALPPTAVCSIRSYTIFLIQTSKSVSLLIVNVSVNIFPSLRSTDMTYHLDTYCRHYEVTTSKKVRLLINKRYNCKC